MERTDYSKHAYALDVSGYTILPSRLSAHELDALGSECDHALAAVRAATKAGRKLAHTGGSDYYLACRCMYCWGDACLGLLENEAIHALATLTMGRYRLWDMAVMTALPTPPDAPAATTSWHRDFAGLHFATQVPGYLWFFVCLDDVTRDNGATWVVPGSHRIASKHEPAAPPTWSSDDFALYPSGLQLCARAGDLLVLSPSLLHTSGRNSTNKPRRLLNVGLCHADLQPLLDHWTIAGPAIQKRASEHARKMLAANHQPLDTTWSVLPEGWQTGRA